MVRTPWLLATLLFASIMILVLMPVAMALAGPVSELIGLRMTFFIAAVVPGVAAVVATVWAKLPADEIAHPLRD